MQTLVICPYDVRVCFLSHDHDVAVAVDVTFLDLFFEGDLYPRVLWMCFLKEVC
jgi:hypothetical protein